MTPDIGFNWGGGGGGDIGETALQRHNAKNLKHIFPEKELRSLSPNFRIHLSVIDL
jgi:hypothetical protein